MGSTHTHVHPKWYRIFFVPFLAPKWPIFMDFLGFEWAKMGKAGRK